MNSLMGMKIKNLREAKNYSQEYVSDYISISQPTLARIEAGKTSTWVNYIDKICSLFEIEVVDLLIPDHIQILNTNSNDQKKEALLVDDIMRKLIKQYEENISMKEQIIQELRQQLQKCQNKK